MCYCNLNDPQRGMEYIDASLGINPFHINAIIQKGTLHYQLGETQLGEQMFDKAIRITPEDEIPDTITGITYSYFFLKDYIQTIKWGEKIIENYPDDKNNILVLLIYSYFELGYVEKCLSLLNEVRNILKQDNPNDASIKENLNEFINELKNKTNNINFNFDDIL